MSNLTMRSKITVYYTTNPADMGYDGTPSYGEKGAWKLHDGTTMSLRKAASFAYELGQAVGQGTYKAICYKNNGREVERREIENIIAADEARRAGY